MASWGETGQARLPHRAINDQGRAQAPACTTSPRTQQAGSSWRTFLAHYKDEMVACDCFTVETAWLQTLYGLCFIELGSRRVHLAGCTANPTRAWVTQQARHLSWKIQDGRLPVRFLIHDRDTKFTTSFDTVFTAEGVTIIRTPIRAPNAHAFAERWIRSVREECLDKLLLVGERHLHRVLTAYVPTTTMRGPIRALLSSARGSTLPGWARVASSYQAKDRSMSPRADELDDTLLFR